MFIVSGPEPQVGQAPEERHCHLRGDSFALHPFACVYFLTEI